MMNHSLQGTISNKVINEIRDANPMRTVSSESTQGEYVFDLLWNDVLLGRGTGPNEHPGNIQFHKMISERKSEYITTTRRNTKALIAKEIVTRVHQQGGRFLKKINPDDAAEILPRLLGDDISKFEADLNQRNESRSLYQVQPSSIVMEKAKQALRRTNAVTEPECLAQPMTRSESLTKECNPIRIPTILSPLPSPRVSRNTVRIIDSLPPEIFYQNTRRSSNNWSVCTPASNHVRHIDGSAQFSISASNASSRRNSMLPSLSSTNITQRDSILPSTSSEYLTSSLYSYQQRPLPSEKPEIVFLSGDGIDLDKDNSGKDADDDDDNDTDSDTRRQVELITHLKKRCKTLHEEVEFLQERLELELRQKRIQKLRTQLSNHHSVNKQDISKKDATTTGGGTHNLHNQRHQI